MRLASNQSAPLLVVFLAFGALLTGCPEKGGGAADKTTAEPEHAEEPDDQGKLDEKAKKPAAAAPAAAPAEAEDKKEKDEGGW